VYVTVSRSWHFSAVVVTAAVSVTDAQASRVCSGGVAFADPGRTA
jgi:hypothetical protein